MSALSSLLSPKRAALARATPADASLVAAAPTPCYYSILLDASTTNGFPCRDMSSLPPAPHALSALVPLAAIILLRFSPLPSSSTHQAL